MEGMSQGQGSRYESPEKSPIYKSSLDGRAATEEEKQLLVRLRRDARDIEERLAAAYGTAPSREEIADAIEEVRNDMMYRTRHAWGAGEPPVSLLSIAGAVRALGRHHNNYHVGAAYLGMRKDVAPNENPWRVSFNANTKIDENGNATKEAHKWCAEQYLLDEAREWGIEIVAMVVAAVPREIEGVANSFKDTDSNTDQITLTPCELCRTRMLRCSHDSDAGPAILKPDTEVYTVNLEHPGRLIEKYQKVKDLERFHGRGRPPQKNVL